MDFDNPLLLFRSLATERREMSESRGRVLIPSGQPLAGQTPKARDAAVIAMVKGGVGGAGMGHRAGFALKLHKSHLHFRGWHRPSERGII